MPRTVETFRTTTALRDLVRKAARIESKRPSELLRQAAEGKARAVIAARAPEDLPAMLDRLPPGRAADDAEAERAAEAAGAVRLVVTDALEEEYRRAVEHPQVVRCAPTVNRRAFASTVVAVADRVVAGEASGLVASDPADEMILEVAIGGAG